jgi:hypothetical protein
VPADDASERLKPILICFLVWIAVDSSKLVDNCFGCYLLLFIFLVVLSERLILLLLALFMLRV